jgi:3-oxoacyl-[acyl-carrier-protein] synthase-3
MGALLDIGISGTGSAVPPRIITNKQIDEHVEGTSAEWTEKVLGINRRHVVGPALPDPTTTLASLAGLRAIADAKLTPLDIDLIIVATATPDKQAPSTACLVQRELEAWNAAAFDLAAVCTGFLYGMTVAAQFIHSGMYRHVLVIGADTFSKVTDWERRDCVFFGDGAGAVVMSRMPGGYFVSDLYADGRGAEAFSIEHVESFEMDGKAVYENATTRLPLAIYRLLESTEYSLDDVNYIVPHQPGIGVLKETARRLCIPFNRIQTNMEEYANTAGATIPLLLDEVSPKFKAGDLILFAAIGSGWTYGATLMRWMK